MAVSFDGSTQFLRRSTAFGNPFSVSLWFYPTNNAASTQSLFCVQNATATEYQWVYFIGNTGAIAAESCTGGSISLAGGVTGINFNAWNHVCAVFDPVAGNVINLNGGSTNTGTYAAAAGNRCRIAARQTAAIPVTHAQFFTGSIAEIGVWQQDIDATWADMRYALADGYSPIYFDKFGVIDLLAYWPFYGRIVDDVNDDTLTADGGPPFVSNPPKMIYPVQGQKVRRTPPVVSLARSWGTIIG